MSGVNIVTSDRGWVLETLAGELARRLPYVRFGDGPERDAAIQYYVTYSCRRRRLSPVEVAYFAHLEPDPPTRDAFFATARAVEHCVCHSRPYEAMLREAGVGQVTTIAPGVDLDRFRPKLRIGVVGRAYHTGRKGEHLVAAVMDIPEIEWSFTGEGWPGPALNLPAEALPDYYRGLDYVLVPALYEGGPMCVVEALACGTEVIAPPVGWVPDFPHVEYRVGDAADLRRVLLELVERKRALRASVAGRGWDAWAEGHDRLFQALAKRHGLTLAAAAATPRRTGIPRRVGLFLHGSEGLSQGGPSVRAPRLARELSDGGIAAELRLHPDPRGFDGIELVHAFNSWPAWSAPDLLRRARAAGKAVVFSPILLDHGTRDLWEEALPRLFAEATPGAPLAAALEEFRAEVAARRAAGGHAPEPAPGFHAAVREMCALADRLVLLGETERARLAAIGAETAHGVVVRNPVDAALFAGADPALFRAATGLDDFVLCLARLEPRKNQLMLIEALRGTGLPLVLVGHGDNAEYRALLERHRGPDVHILDRLEPNSPLLASACAAARVAVLASWSEGAPLVALEAGAAGAALVLSEESGAREHLAEISLGCSAADPASIRDAVLQAWETARDPEAVAARKHFIAAHFGWDRHREATEQVYAEALAAARARGAAAPSSLPVPPPARDVATVEILMDLTTSANRKGRWTGIARVEAALALALAADARTAIRFVAWNNDARAFVEMPLAALRDGTLAEALAAHDTAPTPFAPPPPGTPLLVAGSGWMQNPLYAEQLAAFARRHALRLTPVIHDVIPTKFPFWYEPGYAPVFAHNLALLLDAAESLIAVSEATRRDVVAFAARNAGLAIPDIALLREGDEIRQLGAPEESALPRIAGTLGTLPFVLAVGAIHARKNHRLLHDAWLKLMERMGERCPHLVIVGGVAWNGTETARALAEDRRLAGRVHLLAGVDDEALAWLYETCLFTAYPSLDEGWGLPVAESLRHGKPCLASDIPSVREIAPGLVELLDPLDVMAWVTKLHFYANSPAARAAATARIAAEHVSFSWAQSADMLIELLTDAADRPRPPRPYTPGAVVDLPDRLAAARFRGAGWHPVEDWGCWSAEARADLVFEPAAPIGQAAVFLAEARALAAPGSPFAARILANGQEVARWALADGTPRVLHAIIPAAIAAAAPRIALTIESPRLVAVREAGGADDPRQVGLGLSRMVLAPLAEVGAAGTYFGAAHAAQRPGPWLRLLAGEGHHLLRGAWMPLPGWGMAPTTETAGLAIALHDHPGRDAVLLLRLRPVATAAAPLTLRAMADDAELGAWRFDGDEPVEIAIPLPAALRGRRSPLPVHLRAEPAQAPAALGLGASAVPFGFGLIGLALRIDGVPASGPRLGLPPGGVVQVTSALGAAELAALGPDWHAPEPDATWSFGAEARLPLRFGTTEALVLEAELEAFAAPPGAAAARITAMADGEVLAAADAPPGARRNLAIPVPAGRAGPGGTLDLVLRVDAAASPFMRGAGSDERPLGLRLTRLEALPPAGPPPPAEYDLSIGGDVAPLALEGWFEPEPDGRWSRAEGATMRLPRPRGAGERLRLILTGRVFGTAIGGPARLDLSLDGTLAAFLVFPDDAFATREALLDIAEAGPEIVIGLRRPGALSPAEAGEGQDSRKLGLLLRNLRVVWE